MTLTYEIEVSARPLTIVKHNGGEEIDYDVEYEEYEYDLSIEQVEEFYNSLSEEEFVDACKHAFEAASDSDKEYWTTEYFTADELTADKKPNWNKVFSDKELKDQIIVDLLLDDEDYLEDQMKEYFQQDAEDEFWANR